jgi:tRNA(Arg) A34 adenosine deaminase TadA
VYDIAGDARLNHRFEVVAGIDEARCRETLQRFFRERR